ncbi:copper homeostasis protein CutC [Membranihabitans marinus]|uniref:copper homeostasis protein CutC n=1 Tax=Membranihabitans marinus TaxID=1227546 RepID=UPI001F42294F|nr:copper homeostasis protein CutC [Membranihabitans marinus]
MKIEIAANSLQSALIADQAGAHRIELCSNLEIGGTTPSPGQILCTKAEVKIPINVLIRPRGGDFIYSPSEMKEISSTIQFCKEVGVHGIVIGFVTKDGCIDIDKTKEIITLAGNMDITFHRAFDQCLDQEKALTDLIELGIPRVLTSGGKNSVSEGVKQLQSLVKLAGDDIIVMPGGGINENNILDVYEYTQAKEFHLSGKIDVKSTMEYRNKSLTLVNLEDIHDYNYLQTNGEKIERLIKRISL